MLSLSGLWEETRCFEGWSLCHHKENGEGRVDSAPLPQFILSSKCFNCWCEPITQPILHTLNLKWLYYLDRQWIPTREKTNDVELNDGTHSIHSLFHPFLIRGSCDSQFHEFSNIYPLRRENERTRTSCTRKTRGKQQRSNVLLIIPPYSQPVPFPSRVSSSLTLKYFFSPEVFFHEKRE